MASYYRSSRWQWRKLLHDLQDQIVAEAGQWLDPDQFDRELTDLQRQESWMQRQYYSQLQTFCLVPVSKLQEVKDVIGALSHRQGC